MSPEISADTTTRQTITRFLWALAALWSVLGIGTVGYKIIAPEATWLDCLYMTFITIATIGYGEIVDLSARPGGRVFTMFIAFAGIGVSAYIISAVTAYLVEGKINEVLWRRRMEKQIHKLGKHYIVCGIGRVGRNVANELAATGRPYVVVDEDMRSIQTHLERHPDIMYLHGDASDDDVLIKAHIETAAGVFAVTGDDSKNLLITITAKQINPEVRIVTRCHEVRNIEKIRKAGADAIVSPDFTGGLRMASAMVRPHVVTFLDEMLKSDDSLRVEEIIIPAGFPETPLGALNLKSRDYIVLAIRDHQNWQFNPGTEETLRAGSALIVMATPEGRHALEKIMGWV